jgi:hypothetical protein
VQATRLRNASAWQARLPPQLLLKWSWLGDLDENLGKTRIAAQRIPRRRKLELAVGRPGWDFHDNLELLNRLAVTLPIELKRPLSASGFVFLL